MSERTVIYYGYPTPLGQLRNQALSAPSYFYALPIVEVLLEYCWRRGGDAEVEAMIVEIRQHFHYVCPISIAPASENNLPRRVIDEDAEVVELLLPIFYGVEDQARKFLKLVKSSKPTQITALVNSLVKQGKISELSCKRDLWSVLHDAGLYKPTESNWNSQIHF